MITANVSHEMRTPINAILTMLESLMLTNENPEQHRMCQIIKNSAKLLLYLVNDMLDVYMLKTGKF
jgi:signal transduction histidine kinase